MAWHDNESDFFDALKGNKLELVHNSGYFTVADTNHNSNVGTYSKISHEYFIKKPGWGKTGYVLHTHQEGSFTITFAHIKESTFGATTLMINGLTALSKYLP